MPLDLDLQNVPHLVDVDPDSPDNDYLVTPALMSDEAIASRGSTHVVPSLTLLLTQAVSI